MYNILTEFSNPRDVFRTRFVAGRQHTSGLFFIFLIDFPGKNSTPDRYFRITGNFFLIRVEDLDS